MPSLEFKNGTKKSLEKNSLRKGIWSRIWEHYSRISFRRDVQRREWPNIMTSRYKWKKEIGRRKLYGKKNEHFDGSMRVIII